MMKNFQHSSLLSESNPTKLNEGVRSMINDDLNIVVGALRSIMQNQSLTWKVVREDSMADGD